MKRFTQHLREAVISRTKVEKVVKQPRGYKKAAKAALDRLRAETTHDGKQFTGYLDTGHDNPNARWLAKWGLPPTDDPKQLRQYLPLLWWWDSGKIVVWEIPPKENAQDVVHDEVPQYRTAASKARHSSGMTDYQGRVDRFRKVVSIISAATGQHPLRDRALRRGKNRVMNTLARMFPGYAVIDMDVEGELSEGVEHGDTPKPKPEYFLRSFSIGGKIVQLHPVFGIPVKGREYMRKRFRIGDREGFSPYVDSPGQKAYDIKMSVWRWRVRIQTDEGWMLMGYIGRSGSKESLPPIRMGDRVEVSDLVLSKMTGGNLVTTALGWRGYGDTQYSEKQVDYRSRRFDRQLHGKVKRARA